MTVRAVVFDYFGTLTPTILAMVTPGEQADLGAALRVPPDELERAWRASFVARGTGQTGDLRATLAMLAAQLGSTPTDAGLDAAVAIRAASYRRAATPRPDALAVLTSLRARGLGLAVVSDCSRELPAMWPDLPLAGAIDATVFSAIVGRRKPDPLLYRLACDGLGVMPAECLYVGDGGSGELTGAAAVGMRPVLLADEDWARGHRYDADTWHGPAIAALAEVPALIDTVA